MLPVESLTEAKRSHQANEIYCQTIVSNHTYKEPNSELHTIVCLPECKQQDDPTLFKSTATLDHLFEENKQEKEKEPSTSLKPPEAKSPANQFAPTVGGYKDSKVPIIQIS